MAVTDELFEEFDTNHNGSLSMSEVEEYLKRFHAPKDTIPVAMNAAKKDAGADKVLDKKEFNKMINQVTKNMC